MKQNRKNKLYWTVIFGLKEVEQYLKPCDIKELSSVNKYLREKLKSSLYRHINLAIYKNSYIKYRHIPNDDKEETKEKVKEFLKELYPYNLFAKKVSCSDYISIYLLSSLFSVCSQLKTVWFHYTYIPIPTLKNIFEALNSIETLSLTNITAVQCTDCPLKLSDLILPSTLKNLKIQYCKVEKIEHSECSKASTPLLPIFDNAEDNFFLFKYSPLANIESISLLSNENTSVTNINDFLVNQYNLKALEIEGSVINQITFDILASLTNFEALSLKSVESTNYYLYGEDQSYNNVDSWSIDNIPTFKGLKRLRNTYSPSYSSFKSSISSFPNLEYLELNFNEEIIEYFIKNATLKKLTLNYNNNELDYTLPFSNLEHLEIIIDTPLYINFNSLTNSTSLKFIKISFTDEEIYEDNSIISLKNYLDKIATWKFKILYLRIMCYKTI
ncbi:hypothetical protein CONCODRAFT_6765 [Conidiobolus coronatus NRRL 28638]|uniref:RNI-like protein n=1 Tax=Conidiobolus coronatus (strain ATCC 28846 / CBS 209.66 / NRRL 28638) TaxID=796925 RepID=A0A137P6W8_CONC2|nr:hypothetical protein CONCODRAFT_6765 [Conidiobolus coronatus NRRL 28638]|eukprot:KXN70684.1 hypothetical protein CONCODRAFT_6765 [Conidiobolus coronatus NRRL 28638]